MVDANSSESIEQYVNTLEGCQRHNDIECLGQSLFQVVWAKI